MDTNQFNYTRAPDIKLPDFNSITRRILQENVHNDELNLPYLKQYEDSRKKFEVQGFQHNMTCLLKAFCFELEKSYKPLGEVSLIRSTSLFCTLLMFREFEMVTWASFCSPDKIAAFIKENSGHPEVLKKTILSHLINTAYYTKRQVTNDDQFLQYQAFFDTNFQIFQGRHTDWLLLNEPDISLITPSTINSRFSALIDIYWSKVACDLELNSIALDFNDITNKLVFDQTLQSNSQTLRRLDKLSRKRNAGISQLKKRRKNGVSQKTLIQYVEQDTMQDERAHVMEDLNNAEIGLEQPFLNDSPKASIPQPYFHESVLTPVAKQPFAGEFLTKTVSNFIVLQGNTSNKKPDRVADGVTLNESLMCQSMKSRIYDMNMLMKQIEEPGDGQRSQLKLSNQKFSNFDQGSYHNTGAGSQFYGQNLFGPIKTSSIVVLDRPQQMTPSIHNPLLTSNPTPQNHQNSTVQYNSQLYQQPHHSMSYYLGFQGNSGQNLPTQQSSFNGGLGMRSFLKNSFNQTIPQSYLQGQQSLISPNNKQEGTSSGLTFQPKLNPILSDLLSLKSPIKGLIKSSLFAPNQPFYDSKPSNGQAQSLIFQQQQFVKKESQAYYPPQLAQLRNQVREQCLKQVSGDFKNVDPK